MILRGRKNERCLFPLRLLLVLVLFMGMSSVEAEAKDDELNTAANVSDDFSDLRKSAKNMLDNFKSDEVKESYKKLHSSLSSLVSELDKTEFSKESITELVDSVKSEMSRLQSDEGLKEMGETFKTSFDQLKTDANVAHKRLTNVLENGLGYTMPVTVPYLDDAPFAIKLTFDSLRFIRGDSLEVQTDDKIIVDADASFAFPFAVSSDSANVVRFRGKNVPLAGVNQTARISLASSHRIDLMKNKVAVEILSRFPKGGAELGACSTDDETWLEFDCNGVQDMNLCGRFVFNNAFISAASSEEGKETVYAYFSFRYRNGMVSKVCFSDAFKVKGCGDFIFRVTDAIADWSNEANANGFAFPSDYWDNGLPEEAWTGFFLKKMEVTFPEDLDFNKKKEAEARLQASTVLIDDYGFTGNFLLTDFVDTKGDSVKSDNSGLSLAIDSLGVSFWQGDLASGLIAGRVDAPFLSKLKQESPSGDLEKDDGGNGNGDAMQGETFSFRGDIRYNASANQYLYNANVNLNKDTRFKVPFTNFATVDLTKDSYLEVHNKKAEKGIEGTLCLNGSLNIESSLKIKGVRFEGLKLSSESPHIGVKSAALVGSTDFSLAGFGIELKKLGFSSPKLNLNGLDNLASKDEKFNLDLDAQISLMVGGDIGAGVGVKVLSAFKNSHWKVEGLEIDKIMIDCDFSAFHLKGSVERKENDEVYGDYFAGGVLLMLKDFGFGVNGEVLFGNKDGMKYWFTKADVNLEGAKILLFPPGVFLKSFTGGAYHHASRESSVVGKTISLAKMEDYKPNKDVQFGFLAGVGLYFMEKSLVAANVELEMNFNTHWGINYVRLTGIASILSELNKDTDSEKLKSIISAWLQAEYDRPNKTFHAEFEANIEVKKVLTGNANMQIHTDPNTWYLWLGTRQHPNNLEFVGFLDAKSYFMLGQIPSSLPPMDEIMAAKQGITKSEAEGKDGEISMGKGFAFGVGLSARAKAALPLDIIYARFYIAAGTDLLVVHLDETSCGKADWRAMGRGYVLMGGKVGAVVPCLKRKDFRIFEAYAEALLAAQVPKPVYVSGELRLKCKVAFIDFPKLDISVSAGKMCE